MIIAIDGPSGTGKTTVARLVAEQLGYGYFDTGAMYRAFSWYLLTKGIELTDTHAIESALPHFSFSIIQDEKGKRYFVGRNDVTDLIRSKNVTDVVSLVSSYRPVRDLLSQTQREYGKKGNAVFEGRDLGTVIFPHAEVKVFLTARADVRAKRRYAELQQKNSNQHLTEKDILEAINKRDELDSTREIAPLKCACDAFVLDTSDLSIDQVVVKIVEYTRRTHTS
jgi:cytidylate kinase